MQVISAFFLIREFLPYQMSSVGGCIDQHIVRLYFQSTLNNSFQIFIFNFKFFKAQIIHINDKFIVSVLDLCNHIIEILELMLVHLDHTQSQIVIAVDNTLDTGGFTSTCITKQQAVICRSSLYECLCIINELLLRNLIANQILQFHMVDILDCLNLHLLSFRMRNTERFIQTKLTYTISGIKFCNNLLDSLCTVCMSNFSGYFADTVPDSGIVYMALLMIAFKMPDIRKGVLSEFISHLCEVIVGQFLDNCKIM